MYENNHLNEYSDNNKYFIFWRILGYNFHCDLNNNIIILSSY
jgi:hypothetical protein